MSEINFDRLTVKIRHSRELTALEKRFLEGLMHEEVRRGRWLPTHYDGLVRCSNCRVCLPEKTSYCGNCGAEMEGA